MPKRLLNYVLLCALTLFWAASTASAAEVAAELPEPKQVVESVFDEAVDALIENQDAIREDPKVAFDLMNEILAPRVDFNLMSRLVLGRASRDATEEQMQQFEEAFRVHTMRTYASMLSDNVDTVVKMVEENSQVVEISEATEPDSRGRVSVKTRLLADDPPIPVTYRMIATEDRWKVYDLVIENISFVMNSRNEFGNQISRNGLDGLIEQLEQRNQRAWTN